MRAILASILAAALAACASASAQQTPQQTAQAPCSTPEFRQMDFWLGTWDAYYSADAAAPGGRNVITRAYGGCVIQEDFDGGAQAQGLIGHSVSTYHAQAGRWRQTWVDNQGGYFALVGGPEGDRFVLVNHRLSDNAPVQRMVFEDITPRSFTWRWQASADAGATWTDSWVIYYRRRPV
jgi:hypothetical protein